MRLFLPRYHEKYVAKSKIGLLLSSGSMFSWNQAVMELAGQRRKDSWLTASYNSMCIVLIKVCELD